MRSRQLKHYDKNTFLTELRDIMQYEMNNNNPEALWEDFKTKFLLVADVHTPQITRKVESEYTPWITNNIIKQIYHGDFLKKKAIKTGSENIFVAYKKSRNAVNKLIKYTKRNDYTSALNDAKNNPKNMWNTINNYHHEACITCQKEMSLKTQLRYRILLIRISIQLEKI